MKYVLLVLFSVFLAVVPAIAADVPCYYRIEGESVITEVDVNSVISTTSVGGVLYLTQETKKGKIKPLTIIMGSTLQADKALSGMSHARKACKAVAATH